MSTQQGPMRSVISRMGFALIALTMASGFYAFGEDSPLPGKKKEEKVKAEAHLSVNKLAPGQECRILIRLTIQDGWHINSNPAKPEGFIATEIGFKGGLGTKLTDLKYPKGELITMKNFDEKVSVYDGKVDIFGKLVVPASAAGKTEEMEIVVKYQACDDEKCLLPASIKLSGRLPVAASGEAVRNVNEKLFSDDRL